VSRPAQRAPLSYVIVIVTEADQSIPALTKLLLLPARSENLMTNPLIVRHRLARCLVNSEQHADRPSLAGCPACAA